MADRPRSEQDSSESVTDSIPDVLPRQSWQQFIDLTYRSTLNRPADAPGMAHYLQLLEQGIPAVDIIVEMMSSDEYKRIHRGYSHRLDTELEPYFSTPIQELATQLQQQHLISKKDYEAAWKRFFSDPTAAITNQGDYGLQHKNRFYQTFNDIARLCQKKSGAKVLEFGASHFSNLYGSLLPDIHLSLSGQPASSEHQVFTEQHCKQIDNCKHYYPIDLNQPQKLSEAQQPAAESQDIIVLPHVLSALSADPVDVFSALLSKLSPTGFLYISTSNLFSKNALDAIAQRHDPNSLRGRNRRDFSLKELINYIELAGGECKTFYFTSYDNQDISGSTPEDQRDDIVLVAQRGYPPLKKIDDSHREIVIHIGSDKTGSTAIQTHIYGNREWLKQRGIYIPQCFLGPGNGYEQLFREPTKEKLETLCHEISTKAQKHRKVFLTWEGTHFASSASIKLLAKYLSPYKVRLLFYVREQADIIQSGLLQQIKTERFAIDLKKVAKHPGTPSNRNYYKTIKRWERHFDQLACDVVYFDREKFPKGNIVGDLLNRLGCYDHTDFSFFDADINISLDVASALTLNQIDEEFNLSRKQRMHYTDLLLRNIKVNGATSKLFLTRQQIDNIRRHYLESNQSLINQYDVSDKLISSSKQLDTGSTSHFEPDIGKQIKKIRLAVEKLQKFPVCFGAEVRKEELAKHLNNGWHTTCHGGFWSKGRTSILRMRPLLQGTFPYHFSIGVIITGRYHNDIQANTEVIINNKSFGAQNLTDCTLTLPLTDLPESAEIEIYFKHSALTSADQKTKVAFFIESLQLQLNRSL